MVAEGTFREDLYYRLQVVHIHLPPLRERKDDLTDLMQTLLARINRELHRNVSHISREVMECLESYEWPGNVRELENVLMKGVALSSGTTLTPDRLPEGVRCGVDSVEVARDKPLEQWSLEELEKVHVQRVLDANGWHRGRACEVLGVSRPRLRRMIRQYGMTSPVGREEESPAGDDG